MRILFCNDYHLPQVYRGVEVNTHALAEELLAAGHAPAVAGALTRDGWLGLRLRGELKLLPGRRFTRDASMGYPTYRARSLRPALPGILAAARPDCVVCQTSDPGVIEALAESGVPGAVYLHFIPGWPALPKHGALGFMTNSRFMHDALEQAYGVGSAIIRPVVPERVYRTEVRGQEVTSIGISPEKGADIVLDLAQRMPETGFRIYANERVHNAGKRAMVERARALPNVTLAPRQTSSGKLYATTRVLMAPSRCIETWGRVVTEAQINGIPVLASTHGGLPEAVGEGGICLPPEAPAAEWEAALRQLLADEAVRAGCAAAMRARYAEGDLASARICAEFLAALG